MQWEEQEFPNGEKDYSKIVQVNLNVINNEMKWKIMQVNPYEIHEIHWSKLAPCSSKVIDHDQYMEMRERRPLKPLEGEKVLEGEGEKVLEGEGEKVLEGEGEKVLETEIKTDFFRVFGVKFEFWLLKP